MPLCLFALSILATGHRELRRGKFTPPKWYQSLFLWAVYPGARRAGIMLRISAAGMDLKFEVSKEILFKSSWVQCRKHASSFFQRLHGVCSSGCRALIWPAPSGDPVTSPFLWGVTVDHACTRSWGFLWGKHWELFHDARHIQCHTAT